MSDVPIKKYKPTRQRVINLLQKNSILRDDLEQLITTIWYWDLKAIEKEAEQITAKEFLIIYRSGQLTPAETIRRTWQQVQEKFPDLRGENWMHRHNVGEAVRTTIKA